MTSRGQDMKTLLYGCEDDQVQTSSPAGGKKRLGVASTEVPFATMEHDPHKIFAKSYVKKLAKSTVQEKIGTSRLFDPEVYSKNHKRSVSDQRTSSLRNFEGNGDILVHHVSTRARQEASCQEESHDEDATSQPGM